MIQFLKIIGFSLVVIGLFAVYSNLGIPQIKPAAPPTQEAVDLSSMDMESFIALGENLFKNKGTCALCHNDVGGRAPMLDSLGDGSERLQGDYAGPATNFAEYLIESMNEPSVYVVAGFGKVGTNDKESPMPDVRSGGIGFSEVETLAVVAYIEDANGLEVSVEIPTDAEPVAEVETSAPATAERAKYTSGEEIVAKLGCGACHKIGAFEGAIGPDLSKIGATRDSEHLWRSIMEPNADITEGFAPMMPPIYGDQLYASELKLLVDYMASLK